MKKWLVGLIPIAIIAVILDVMYFKNSPADPASSYQKTFVNSQNQPAKPRISKSDDEWEKVLSKPAFQILRGALTEPAYQNAYWHQNGKGIYVCAACGNKLFSSETKYDSKTGWPTFWKPISDDAVLYRVAQDITTRPPGPFDPGWVPDDSEFYTEVVCANCGGHLGHVFNDGPKPTGDRYCMNSAAMKFIPDKK